MTRDLVVRARKGDHDAFAELAGAAISRLDATAWLMLRDTDRATDAVQNALVRAWRDLPTLRDPDRFDAWLHRLVVRACIDEIRRFNDVDSTSTSPTCPTRRPARMPCRGSPTATSSNAASAGSSPRSGRSSSCITTSTCRCRRSLPRSGSRWVPPNPVCTAGSGRCVRRSTPTLDPGPESGGAPGMNPTEGFDRHVCGLAARGRRAPGAGAPRCGPATNQHRATAPGMVEPRKVAPRGSDRTTSLPRSSDARQGAPRRCRPRRA